MKKTGFDGQLDYTHLWMAFAMVRMHHWDQRMVRCAAIGFKVWLGGMNYREMLNKNYLWPRECSEVSGKGISFHRSRVY